MLPWHPMPDPQPPRRPGWRLLLKDLLVSGHWEQLSLPRRAHLCPKHCGMLVGEEAPCRRAGVHLASPGTRCPGSRVVSHPGC